ncbi:hypothetical protein KC951_04090, partial [Candidatus Saccharibacteria bacterium]|nr:hypothetical protein [Candidatus Saccharibacteria bacterium]
GSAGSYALTLTCSDTSNVEVGDFVIIDSASGGTNPEQAMGCHEVATVNTNTSIVVTSKNLGSLAPSGAVSSSGHVLKSIVNMGSNKLTVSGFGKIEDLVLTGSGTIVNGEDCVLQLSDIGIDGGGTAISLVRSKVSGNLVCSGATTSIKTVMCEGSLEGSVISGTSSAALIAQLSNLVLDNAVAVGCLNGFLADMGSSIHMQSGKSIGNISNGFYANNGSQGYLVLCKFQNNNVGVSANACSSLQVGLATISGNTTADASPTIGTVGNNESLITNTT